MKYLLIVWIVFSLFGCKDDSKEITDRAVIVKALTNGDLVHVRKNRNMEVNNAVVGRVSAGLMDVVHPLWKGGESKDVKAVVTGCFSIPECVKIESSDKHRGIIKISNDDFTVYDDDEYLYGAVTYFFTSFYNPYWSNSLPAAAFRGMVNAANGGAYANKRSGCCANNPEKCHCYE